MAEERLCHKVLIEKCCQHIPENSLSGYLLFCSNYGINNRATSCGIKQQRRNKRKRSLLGVFKNDFGLFSHLSLDFCDVPASMKIALHKV